MRALRLIVATGLALLAGAVAAPAARADSGYAAISGAGSTWSQVAIDAWRADVRANGLVVNYAGTGSTDGRQQYIQHTVDFAASEIPFENPPEPGQPAEVPDRPYAYLPIVAGGTSFMYHLTVAGQMVRNLRLDGATLSKIFTGAITRWSDPAIAANNPGVTLPDEAIVPVIRSDGSGASAQFSRYMSRQFPAIWCPFEQENLGVPQGQCGLTSFYPTFGNAKAQSGSNGVANYVSASYGEGAIGYVEYAYAKRVNYPVVSLLNAAGYYAQPSASNVAVALTKAVINPSDLTQNLDGVYTNPDPRTYPMSSYSYFIVPTSTASPFTTDKGRSLSTFVNYFLCAGQKKAAVLGYSPLPANLVQAGFDQVARIPGAVASPSFSSCDNPALQILQTAPQPDPCAKQGAPAGCGTSASASTGATGAAQGPSSHTSGGRASGSSAGAGPVAGGATGATGALPPGGGTAAPTLPVGGSARPAVGGGGASLPLTGTGTDPTSTTGDAVDAADAAPPTVPSARPASGQAVALSVLAAVALLLAVGGPPFLVRHLRNRQGEPR
ncbi:MAG TPA: phosphate ABC transporter substrate-binding protein PstS [Mycobacteriales bacterium]|nr:phosphate ABC transporter substrate-binding protein PstS [Mycobacteriales bacterium]